MNLHTVKKGIYSSIILAVLSHSAFAGHHKVVDTVVPVSPGKFYAGIFGGYDWTRGYDISQYGSAYFFEAAGGPLAVNAFGDTNNRSGWLLGLQVGYQASPFIINPCYMWGVSPAAELETYYIDQRSFSGDAINAETTRLEIHDFNVSFDLRRTIFLANAVLNFNIPCLMVHPYVGAGFGAAIVRLSGADSLQVIPPEPGVNHFGASTGDTDTTFAGQIKVGLSYDINNCVNVFAEYRWLYLADTHFVLGSTLAPGHAVTSPWQVKLDPQYNNIGAVGIRVNFL